MAKNWGGKGNGWIADYRATKETSQKFQIVKYILWIA
jgi:hypothetical protein